MKTQRKKINLKFDFQQCGIYNIIYNIIFCYIYIAREKKKAAMYYLPTPHFLILSFPTYLPTTYLPNPNNLVPTGVEGTPKN
jgi:hypothetical protein